MIPLVSPHFYAIDERRVLAIPGNEKDTIDYAAKSLLFSIEDALASRGSCNLAISGGNTIAPIIERFTDFALQRDISWEGVSLFWSDERCVPLDHPLSNYHRVMEGGMKKLPLQAHPMPNEGNLPLLAREYGKKIGEIDVLTLGVGEDGHIASLFPGSEALQMEEMVVPTCFEKLWRITFTFAAISQAKRIFVYAIGKRKRDILPLALERMSVLPAYRVGSRQTPAVWIADADASLAIRSRVAYRAFAG